MVTMDEALINNKLDTSSSGALFEEGVAPFLWEGGATLNFFWNEGQSSKFNVVELTWSLHKWG